MNELAWGYYEAGQLNDAVSLFEQILELRNGKTGEDHLDWMNSETNLAKAYRRVGQHGKSVPLFEQALAMEKAKHGDDHPVTLESMRQLADAYREAGQDDKAIARMDEHDQIIKHSQLEGIKPGELDRETMFAIQRIAIAYQEARQFKKARPLLELKLEANKIKLGVDHGWTLNNMNALAAVYLQLNAFEDAENLMRECLPLRKTKKPDHWRRFYTESLLGEALLGQDKHAEAEPLLLDGCQGLIEREDAISPIHKQRVLESIQRLIQLYESWHTIDPDGGHDAKSAQWQKTLQEHEERLSPQTK